MGLMPTVVPAVAAEHSGLYTQTAPSARQTTINPSHGTSLVVCTINIAGYCFWKGHLNEWQW
jgi:hypothetical protein